MQPVTIMMIYHNFPIKSSTAPTFKIRQRHKRPVAFTVTLHNIPNFLDHLVHNWPHAPQASWQWITLHEINGQFLLLVPLRVVFKLEGLKIKQLTTLNPLSVLPQCIIQYARVYNAFQQPRWAVQNLITHIINFLELAFRHLLFELISRHIPREL